MRINEKLNGTMSGVNQHTGQERRKPPIPSMSVDSKLDFVINFLFLLGARVMATDASVQDLEDQVTAQTDQVASVKVMFVGIRQQLADALANLKVPADVQAKINDVFGKLVANSASLADAIAAPGTPVDPNQPTP